ncbi:MAG: hypothetical protein ACI85F_001687 [Bacteroidia bacterium]|jgi:hypothetical protein
MKYLSIIILIGLVACSGSKHVEEVPANIISKDVMVPLLIDIQLIEGANSTKFFQGDTGRANYALLYNTIFEKHEVEKTQFDSSMAYYTAHSKDLEVIYDLVIEELMKIEATELAGDQ